MSTNSELRRVWVLVSSRFTTPGLARTSTRWRTDVSGDSASRRLRALPVDTSTPEITTVA